MSIGLALTLMTIAFVLGLAGASLDGARETRRLRRLLKETQDDLTYWQLVADGTNHDRRCARHWAGDQRFGLCMRCELQDARRALSPNTPPATDAPASTPALHPREPLPPINAAPVAEDAERGVSTKG